MCLLVGIYGVGLMADISPFLLSRCYTLVDGQIVEASNTAPGLGACEACSALLDGRLYCTGCPKDDGTLVDSSINMSKSLSPSSVLPPGRE